MDYAVILCGFENDIFCDDPDKLPKVRMVSVPEWRLAEAKTPGEIAELIFEFGQNDVQKKNVRSVSAGDMVIINSVVYRFEAFGVYPLPVISE